MDLHFAHLRVLMLNNISMKLEHVSQMVCHMSDMYRT